MMQPTIPGGGRRCIGLRLLPVCLLAIAPLIHVCGAPILVQPPGNQSVFAGQTAVFSAQASSALPVTYQWQVNGSNLAGQTNASLEVFSVSLLQSGQVYTVSAMDADGSVTSVGAKLEVLLPSSNTPLYTWGVHPWLPENRFNAQSLRSEVGQVFLVAVCETNLGSLWGTDIYTDDSSVASAAVHSGFLQRGERGTVRVKIHRPQYNYPASNRNGLQSGSYSYWLGSFEIVGRAPDVEEFPASQARMVGGMVSFSVRASGQGMLKYQWSHNENSLNGATNATLTFPVTSASQAGCYSVAITDDNATVVHTATLAVLPSAVGAPAVLPSSIASLPVGAFAGMAVTGKTNAGTIYGNGFYSDWSEVSAAAVHAGLIRHDEEAVVLVVRLQSQPSYSGGMGAGVESVAWSGGAGYALLGRAPRVIDPPLSQIVLPGASARLTFLATDRQNPDFRIQWRRNGELIPGATADNLQVAAGSPGSRTVYDAALSLPGRPTMTLSATLFTPPSTATVYKPATLAEAGQYLGREGNLVYVPVRGITSGGAVWGTGVYTIDSHLGMTAVHAGLVAPGETGEIAVYTVGSWSGFFATDRNGVESRPYSAYSGMVLGAAAAVPLQPFIRLSGPGQFLIEGAAGKMCQILASPTMTPGSWLLIDSRKITSDSQPWADPSVPLPQARFYRLLIP